MKVHFYLLATFTCIAINMSLGILPILSTTAAAVASFAYARWLDSVMFDV